MGAEHSHHRLGAEGHEVFEGDLKLNGASARNTASSSQLTNSGTSLKRRNIIRQSTGGGANVSSGTANKTASPTPSSSEISRPPSPPLSVCSDLPYVSYTDRPIGDSPKIRNKPSNNLQNNSNRANLRKSYPMGSGAKPKRPQSTISSHSIVIVKPGARDNDYDIDPDLARLRNIPQFLPVLRETITSSTFTRDPEILERLQSQHLLNICNRMQTHLNICATQVANEQNHLVERTKVVSNSITTLFASFVDMQKSYACYAEQFAKIRAISQQLSRCNSLLNSNIASLEAINNFLDVDDRLEPFVWRTDDNKLRNCGETFEGGKGETVSNRLKW